MGLIIPYIASAIKSRLISCMAS